MNTRTPAILLGALCAMLICVCAYQQRQLAGLRQRLADALAMPPDPNPPVDQPVPSFSAMAAPEPQAAVAEASAAAEIPAPRRPVLRSQPTEIVAEEEPVASAGRQAVNPMLKMLKDPGMRDMIRAQQKAMLPMMYGALFERLQLPEIGLDTFKELLTDLQIAQMDKGLAMMGDDGDDDDGRQAGTGNAEAETDKLIADLLGDEQYDLYVDYRETLPERMQLIQFKTTAAAVEALTPEQEDALVDVMHAERVAHAFTKDYQNPTEFNPGDYTGQAVATYLEEMSALHEKIAARSGTILNPAQQAAFIESLKSQRAMTEMGMKMAGAMFRGADAADE